jgi:hypothetical protein
LNPAYYRQALQGWCNYVPTDKLLCSHDATSVEMAAGSVLLVRTILAEVLEAQQQSLKVSTKMLYDVAKQLLHDNAARLYAH